MAKTSNKKSENGPPVRFLTKNKAYLYLKGLIEKSREFREKVEILRKNLGIDLNVDKNLPWENIQPFNDGKPSKENRLSEEEIELFRKATIRLEGYIQKPQLTENKEFISLCETYYIPKFFWNDLEIFIYTGNPEKLLNNNIKTVSIAGGTPTIKQKDFLIPHIAVYIPIDTLKEKYINSWKEVQIALDEAKRYWLKVQKWNEEGTTFDRALYLYKIHKTLKLSEKQLEEKIWEAKWFKRRSYINTKEAYRSIKRIGEQIESLQRWQELPS